MTDYGDLSRERAIARLTAATEHERFLDGLVWLNAGCDYPPNRRMDAYIWGPANRINGRSMRTGYEQGLHGVEQAFSVPLVSLEIGAAFTLTSKWFTDFALDLKTGAGAGQSYHRAVLEIHERAPFVGTSRLGGAAAICVCLLKAVPFAGQDLPGYLVETP
jgi:hypothetical protein|nr:hypothetical protein [Neorhizobium tomejilense]